MLGYELRLMAWIKASSPKAPNLIASQLRVSFNDSAKSTI